MKLSTFALTLFATSAIAAAPQMQPPMNNFDFAFYACDAGAFQITYDSETPKSATLTTSDNNKQYVLARTHVADGVEFTSGSTRFWTDGHKVVVQGTARPFQNCRMKAN